MVKTFKKTLALILSIIMLMSVMPMNIAFADVAGEFVHQPIDETTTRVVGYKGSSTDIVIPEKLKDYTVVSVASSGNYQFAGKDIVSITIPDSVITIEAKAFYNCSALETITIGTGLKTVEKNAFSGCNNIKAVNYKGPEAEWDTISFASTGNNKLVNCTNITFYYNYDCNEYGHPNKVIEYKAPTCTEDGNIKHTVCAVCGIITTELEEGASVIIPALHKGLTKTEANDATCFATGNYDFWYCGACDTFFADADANTVYEDGSHIIAVDSSKHVLSDWRYVESVNKHKRYCTNNGCKFDELADCVDSATDNDCLCDSCGNFVAHSFSEATCIAGEVCNVCGAEGAGVDSTNHKLTKTDASDKTCTEAGNLVYWYCSDCKKYFKDENAEVEYEENEWVVAASHSTKYVTAKAATCTVDGHWAHYLCEKCGLTFKDAAATTLNPNVVIPAGHDWSGNYVDGKDGKHYKYCKRDGCTALNEDSAQDHSWNAGEITTAPECEKTGVKTFTCTIANCTATKTETVAATGHTPGAAVKENEVPMECDKDGSYDLVVYCEDCEKELSRTTETVAKGHNITLTFPLVYKKAATCTECAILEVYCSRCEQDVEIPIGAPLGHQPSEPVTIAPTCTKPGYKDYVVCTAAGCDYVFESSTEIDPLDHDWEELDGHVSATCLEGGKNNLRCKREGCGATDTNVTTALGHDYSSAWYTAKNATCTEDGKEQKLCSRCKDVSSLIENILPATGHTFGEVTEAVEATCVAGGNEAYKQCTVCEKYFAGDATTSATNGEDATSAFDTEIDATNHAFATTFTVDTKATCTTVGSKSKHCTRTGCTVKTAEEEIAAREHNIIDDGAETDAACITAGVMNQKCTNTTATDEYEACTHTTTRVIEATGHTFGEVVEAVAATCVAKGNEAYKQCTVCEKYFADDATTSATDGEDAASAFDIAIDSTNHAFATTFTVDTKATCTTVGSKSKHCTRTGCTAKTSVTEIAARGHNIIDDGAETDATCTTAGVMNQKCTNTIATDEYEACTHTTTRPINATGHTFGVVVEAIEATCVAKGNEAYKQCTVCAKYFADDATTSAADGEEAASAFDIAIDARNHAFATTFTVDTKATCTTVGSKSKHCTRTGCTVKTAEEEIAARGHNIIDDGAETDATCITAGVMNQKCSNTTAATEYAACTHTTTRPINATGHTFGEVVEAVEATCVAKGNEAYKQCTVCEKYFADDATTSATDGEEAASAFDIAINAANHDMSDILTSGKSHYKKCMRTGCTYKVEGLDHAKGEFTVTKEATCKEEGEKTAFCHMCKYNITYTIDKVDCKDTNNDKKCDWCGKDLTPATPENPGTGDGGSGSDKPSTPEDPSANCDCGCHAGGLKNLLFKFLLFFQKFLKLNSTCVCGKAHY